MKFELPLPSCKSILIRQMVARFVQTGDLFEVAEEESTDVLVTCAALKALKTQNPEEERTTVDVRDCGAAYRFLMALLSVSPGKWHLTGTDRLLQRPMDELVDALRGIGAEIRRVSDGWQVDGKHLSAETMSIDCTRSSQFASALLLIAPKLGLKQLWITPENAPSSTYIDLTRMVLSSPVEIPQMPCPQKDIGRVGDWSAALYGYALAMLHPENEYELLNLSRSSAQGDSVLADWFQDMGVHSVETERGVLVRAENVRLPIQKTFIVADHPDVVPVLAALACLLPADFKFEGTRNLVFKESDRIKVLTEQLAPFADIDRGENALRIVGRERSEWPKSPYCFETSHDHRMAMAFLLFGAAARLDDVACLKKSLGGLADAFMKPEISTIG